MLRWPRRILTLISTVLLVAVLVAWTDCLVLDTRTMVWFSIEGAGTTALRYDRGSMMFARQNATTDSGFDRAVPDVRRSIGRTLTGTWSHDIGPLGARWAREVPLWFLTVIFGVVPTVHYVGRRRKHRRRLQTCAECGYDLRASDGPCPECGDARESAAA